MSEPVQIFVWSGRFDASAALDRIDRALNEGVPHQVLNMRGLTLIDSAGIGFLIRMRRRLEDGGGELVIAEAPPQLSKNLRALGLGALFRIFDTDEEALAYFGGEEGADGVAARRIPIRPSQPAVPRPPAAD